MEPFNITPKNQRPVPNKIREKMIDKLISKIKTKLLILQAKKEHLNSQK